MNNNLLDDLWESVENGNSIINESTFSTFVYRLIHQYSLQINVIPSGQLYTRFNTLLNTLRQSPTRANLNNLFNWIYHTFHNLNEYDAFEDYLMNPDDEEAIGVNIPVNPDGESDAELNSLWGDDEEDEQNGNGRNPYALLEQKGHEGKFTAQFKARKPHLRHLKTLGEFAHYILANPTEFNKISKQRANYYRNLIERKGGMFKKNIITQTKEEFNELWNSQIKILQRLTDYILDKIEDSRALLQASNLYDDYKNAATEVLRQSRDLIRQLNNLKWDVLDADGLTEEDRTIINKSLGKLIGLKGKISNVSSEYKDIWKSIEPHARMTNRMGESVTALPYVSADYDYIEENDLPEKLLRENRATPTISSISPSVEVPIMARSHLYNLPIDELITALRSQNEKNHDNTILELIHELDDIRSSSSNVPRDQRVNDALKKYGFGRPKRGGLSKKMMKDLRAYHRQVGGKISTKDFNLMLKESYKKPQDRDKHIGDYYIDESLSTPENVVYHNPKTGETKVAYRGTEGTLKDWGNNALYAFGLHNSSKRYKRSNEIQKQVEQKYGTQNLDVLGHSQSGAYAQEIGKNAKNVIVLNPATHPGYTPKTKNATVVRSKGDAVSGLKYLNPLNWGKKKTADVEIKAETYNPVTEHMPDILERLPEDTILGNGRRRKRRTNVNKKLRRLCNCCGAKCPYCR
jgi:hypothetical protein